MNAINWTKVDADHVPPEDVTMLLWVPTNEAAFIAWESWTDVCDLEEISHFAVISPPEDVADDLD